MAIKGKFIDREEELKILEKIYNSDKEEVVIITGRRRIGKTELLKKFVKDKEHIYFTAAQRKIEENIKKFSAIVSEKIKVPLITYSTFKDIFKFLIRFYSSKKIIIVIDEFGYLIEQDKGIISEFQEIIDHILPNTKIKLILTGSTVSLFKGYVFSYKSPLYGRSNITLKLNPFKYKHLREIFPEVSYENVFRIYAVTDGIPKYLEFFQGRDIENEIISNFFNDVTFLFREGRKLLEDELKDSTTYISILESIANGYVSVTQIANNIFMSPKDLPFYLNVLKDLEIIERKTPVLSSRKSKKGIYLFKDNYFAFWYRFVSPYYEDIESGFVKGAITNFNKNFNTYLGRVFESFFEKLAKERFLGENFTHIGRWWHKDKEIDLLAINEQTKELLAVEVKWQDLRLRHVKSIIEELHEKLPYVKWYNEERKEILGVFAKSIDKKAKEWLLSQGYKAWDLRDVEKMVH